jgi:hypothetical protein
VAVGKDGLQDAISGACFKATVGQSGLGSGEMAAQDGLHPTGRGIRDDWEDETK